MPKRRRFLFDEIESGVLSEEDDNILMDSPRGKVVCFDASMSDCNELGGKRGGKSVEEGDILCLGIEDVHGSAGEEIGFTDEDNQAVSINAAEDTHSGESVSASNTRIDCIDLPSFIQQTDILMSLMQGVVDSFPDLNFAMATGDEQPLLQISQRQLHHHPPFGMISRVQVTVQYNLYIAYVMMRKWESGSLASGEDLASLCVKFSSKSEYKFCPGLNPEQYETEYYAVIRFHIKSVRRSEFPVARVDSVNCLQWFKLAPNATRNEKAATEVRCKSCKRLVLDLDCQKRRTIAESPSRKVKRQSASSKARLCYMSPASQLKRHQNVQYARNLCNRKLAKYGESEVTLNEEQNSEMCAIVEKTKDDDLEKLFKEGNEHGVGELMKEIWFTDKKRQVQQFANDQAANGKFHCFLLNTFHCFFCSTW